MPRRRRFRHAPADHPRQGAASPVGACPVNQRSRNQPEFLARQTMSCQ